MTTTITHYSANEITKIVNDRLDKKLALIYHTMDKLHRRIIDNEIILEKMVKKCQK